MAASDRAHSRVIEQAYRDRNRERLKALWKGQKERRLLRDSTYKRRESQRANRRIRERIINAYGGPKCVCCGETTPEFLSIDHINGGGFKHRQQVGQGAKFYRWLIQNDYPPGFQILCFNCNQAKGHWGTCPHQQNGGVS